MTRCHSLREVLLRGEEDAKIRERREEGRQESGHEPQAG
jgi:hypothetical protein